MTKDAQQASDGTRRNDPGDGVAPDATYRVQMRRVVFSSFLGSILEYYDFILYGTLSAIVFGQIFFSNLDPVTGTIASLGTFAAGYLARPVGGLIFGHFGDRLGRKKMLFWSISLMAIASVLMGFLPTYQQVGALAPILLILLRVFQGIAVLMSAEHATSRRGLWVAFTPAGAPGGALLSTAVVTLLSAVMTDEQFLAWGWRIAFFLSVVLFAIAIVVRLRIVESPVFTAAVVETGRPERVPLFSVLRTQLGRVLLGIGATAGMFAASSFITVFLVSYATGPGQLERQDVLNTLTISSAISLVTTILYGALSDRLGRRLTMILGAVATGIVCFLVFPAVASGSVLIFGVIFIIGQAFTQAAWSAATPSLLSEMFDTENRYSGASLAFQVSSALAGGLAPVTFAAVLQATGAPLSVAFIMAGLVVLSVVCLLRRQEQ